MPGKTQGEKIDYLLQLAATLTAQVEDVRVQIERLDQKVSRTSEKSADSETKVALLEQRVKSLEDGRTESSRRLWMVVVGIIGAVTGAILTYLVK